MQSKLHLSSNRNAVKVAEPEPASGKLAIGASVEPRGTEDTVPASGRLLRLRDAVRDLLLDDDLEHEKVNLLSGVSAELNEVLDTFDRLASMQRYFELVMLD
jgi:hypothetical protein